jgi:hypothetical protein
LQTDREQLQGLGNKWIPPCLQRVPSRTTVAPLEESPYDKDLIYIYIYI